MRKHLGQTLYSASDLVNYLGCTHSTALDLAQLANGASPPSSEDPQLELLQEKGLEHERAYLDRLRARGLTVLDVAGAGDLDGRVATTLGAMRAGANAIYQGALFAAPWHGFSDFLLRVDGRKSEFGNFAYDVADTKLSRSAKPKHILQLCVYADLLERSQGCPPERLQVFLGTGEEVSLPPATVRYYYQIARDRFLSFVSSPLLGSAPEPCAHCAYCRWSETCGAQWEAEEHLSLVANIARSQIDKLRVAGVSTLRQLAALPEDGRIPGLQADTLARLRSQARLQIRRRDTGDNVVELLPAIADRGFARLPKPDPADVFFDMEGDPLFEGGLEYLFGLVHSDSGTEHFTAYWAHERQAEKLAFENTVDFMCERLARNPAAHVYHYASYEESALKRLAMLHGTREGAVDDLLRKGKLIDLYKVVREAVRISEPRYSIKNVEVFYMPDARSGTVQTAGDSIVMYERWRRTGDGQLLDEIASYNRRDCESLSRCRDWLVRLRPEGLPWHSANAPAQADEERERKRAEAEARTSALSDALTRRCSDEDRAWRELLAHLLEFHRREAKPTWWAMFARNEMSEDELVDDAECIGALRPDRDKPPRSEKRSTVHSFTFPAQDFKMRVGDTPLRAGTLEPAGEIVELDEDSGTISLKIGPKRSPFDDVVSLIPEGPLGDRVLRDAIYRFAESVATGGGSRYRAVVDIMKKSAPRLSGRGAGEPIVAPGSDLLDGTIKAVSLLDDSYLLVQGPPGSGKTYTSSHAIVALLEAGRRVGIASNSHKAINKLLADVESVAKERNVRFKGIKKSSREDQFLNGTFVADTLDNEEATGGGFQLIAGTAWLFARPELDSAIDHLFIDEAGQVSFANVVAMGVSARNVVLVGDQMQLSQPIQGVHPGNSGISGLEHLLEGAATVPPDRGVFLELSWRMHPEVCRFVSDAVYDGRLRSADCTTIQRIETDAAADPALAPNGIRFVPVAHVDCAQKSRAEAERVKLAYEALMRCRWTDRYGRTRDLGTDDVLVVSPYNMQVNLLREMLPTGARVGTVDKFQGQEAAAVLISMATSSGDDLPRNIEFLFSKNRLNVALSRARCLSVVFASPRLLEVPCNSIEQMQLVNTLCWAKAYSDELLRVSGKRNLSEVGSAQ